MKKIILATLVIICACFANINAQSGNKKATTPGPKPIEVNINSLDTYKEVVASFDSILRVKYKITTKFEFIGSWSITLKGGVIVDHQFEENSLQNKFQNIVSYTKINGKIGGFNFTHDILYDVDVNKPLLFTVVRIKEDNETIKEYSLYIQRYPCS